jgi:hypothetical protein
MSSVALTSCTTWAPPDPSPWRWRKEGVTVEQQRRDQAECATASDRAYNASTGDTTVRPDGREPGRRGLLSSEGLLFAGALILVVDCRRTSAANTPAARSGHGPHSKSCRRQQSDGIIPRHLWRRGSSQPCTSPARRTPAMVGPRAEPSTGCPRVKQRFEFRYLPAVGNERRLLKFTGLRHIPLAAQD